MADTAEIHRAFADMGPAKFAALLGLKGRSAGRSFRVCCPVHNGKDPNAQIFVADGDHIGFVCWSGCGGEGTDALGLIAAVRGLDPRRDFTRVLEEAAALLGMAPPTAPAATRKVEEDPALVSHRRAMAEDRGRVLAGVLQMAPLEGVGLRYMTEDRGIPLEVCKTAQVGYVGDPVGVRRALVNAYPAEVLDELGIVYESGAFAWDRHPLLFPIVRHGKPVYLQGRALGAVAKKHERWRSMRGSVPCLWGVDSLAQAGRPVLLCEGPIDGLTAMAWGPRYAAVAIFGAGGLKDEWVSELRGRTVYVALDADAAGDKGAAKAIKMLLEVGALVRRLPVPRGHDLNSWYLAEGAA